MAILYQAAPVAYIGRFEIETQAVHTGHRIHPATGVITPPIQAPPVLSGARRDPATAEKSVQPLHGI
jgi:hypothetical protein